jgi:hypothetical protein
VGLFGTVSEKPSSLLGDDVATSALTDNLYLLLVCFSVLVLPIFTITAENVVLGNTG